MITGCTVFISKPTTRRFERVDNEKAVGGRLHVGEVDTHMCTNTILKPAFRYWEE